MTTATAYINLTSVQYRPGILGFSARVRLLWNSNVKIAPEDNEINSELNSERFIDQLYISSEGEGSPFVPLNGYNLIEHTIELSDGTYQTDVLASVAGQYLGIYEKVEIALYVVSKNNGIIENRDYVSVVSNLGLVAGVGGTAAMKKTTANINNGYIGFVEKSSPETSASKIDYKITDLVGIEYETVKNFFPEGNEGVVLNYGEHNLEQNKLDTIAFATPANREYSRQIKKHTTNASYRTDYVYYFNFKKQINNDAEVGGKLPDGTVVNPVPESPDVDFDEDGKGNIPPGEDIEIIIHPPADLPDPGPNDGDKEVDVNVPPGTDVDLDIDYGQEDPEDPNNPDYFYSTITITARNYKNENIFATLVSTPSIEFNNGVAELSEPGAYTITVSADGYKSESLYVNIKSTGINFKADVFLIKESSNIDVGGTTPNPDPGNPDPIPVIPVPESPGIDFDEDGTGEIPPGEDTEIIIHPPVDLPDPGPNDGDKELDVNVPPGTDVDLDIDYGQEDPEDPANPDYFYSTITITARNEYSETLAFSIDSVPVIEFNDGVAELSEPGAYTITVSADGYKSESLYVNIKSTGINFKADVSLEKDLEPTPEEDDNYFLIYQPYFNEINLNLGE